MNSTEAVISMLVKDEGLERILRALIKATAKSDVFLRPTHVMLKKVLAVYLKRPNPADKGEGA